METDMYTCVIMCDHMSIPDNHMHELIKKMKEIVNRNIYNF